MQKNFDASSLQEALRFAQSPAGKQLLSTLRQKHSAELEQLMTQVNTGNGNDLQKNLAALLGNQEVRSMLQKLQEDMNG